MRKRAGGRKLGTPSPRHRGTGSWPLGVGCCRVSRLGLIPVAPSGGLGEDLGTDTDALRSTMTDETLASWKRPPGKAAIVGLVRSASEEGSGFVPVADRIATSPVRR